MKKKTVLERFKEIEDLEVADEQGKTVKDILPYFCENVEQALLKQQEQENVLNEALKLNGKWAEELDYYRGLEERLGCSFEVMVKALGHWIYDEDGSAWYIEHYYQECNVYQLHSVRHCGKIIDKKFNTKDYKKTWFLKKDKSE